MLNTATFLATGYFFWWAVAGIAGAPDRPAMRSCVFIASLPGTLFGALMTLSTAPWYPHYATGSAAHALQDQQLAGVVMWAGGGMAYVAAGAALFVAWLRDLERIVTVATRLERLRDRAPRQVDRRAARRLARRTQGAQQGVPRPLVVHARRDRAVLASSCSSSPASTSRSSSTPASTRSCTTARTSRCNGVRMSEAYESVVHLSFDVRAGLVMRQIHHWAALVFLAAIVAHLCRIFFTGAFRRPREINWIVGVTLLLLALANGFAGYSLPDDLLSGTGLRIANSFMLSIPLVGTCASRSSLFGGEFPGTSIISRLVHHPRAA